MSGSGLNTDKGGLRLTRLNVRQSPPLMVIYVRQYSPREIGIASKKKKRRQKKNYKLFTRGQNGSRIGEWEISAEKPHWKKKVEEKFSGLFFYACKVRKNIVL